MVLVTNATENEKDHKAESVVLGTIKNDPKASADESNNSATRTEKKDEKKEEKKDGKHPCCEPLHL